MEPAMEQEGSMDTPPQTSGPRKPGCSNSWLPCLKAWLGDFLSEPLLQPTDKTLLKGGKFFMRQSSKERRHRAGGTEKEAFRRAGRGQLDLRPHNKEGGKGRR